MAALTDLQWQQLSEALGGNDKIFVGEDPQGNIGLLISVSEVNGESVQNTTSTGVVKFLVKLREACRVAQESANESQADGEKLNAFPAATSNGTIVNGSVIQTGSIQAAILVSSASTIVGITS